MKRLLAALVVLAAARRALHAIAQFLVGRTASGLARLVLEPAAAIAVGSHDRHICGAELGVDRIDRDLDRALAIGELDVTQLDFGRHAHNVGLDATLVDTVTHDVGGDGLADKDGEPSEIGDERSRLGGQSHTSVVRVHIEDGGLDRNTGCHDGGKRRATTVDLVGMQEATGATVLENDADGNTVVVLDQLDRHSRKAVAGLEAGDGVIGELVGFVTGETHDQAGTDIALGVGGARVGFDDFDREGNAGASRNRRHDGIALGLRQTQAQGGHGGVGGQVHGQTSIARADDGGGHDLTLGEASDESLLGGER